MVDVSELTKENVAEKLTWRQCTSEEDLATVIKMMSRDLSEPYPIWTYRYFVHQWPELSMLVTWKGQIIGSILSKLD